MLVIGVLLGLAQRALGAPSWLTSAMLIAGVPLLLSRVQRHPERGRF
jgi:hypothetical protein